MKSPSFFLRGGVLGICAQGEGDSLEFCPRGEFYGFVSKGENFRDLCRFAKGVKGWNSRGLCQGGFSGSLPKGGFLGSFPKGCQRVGNYRDLCKRDTFSEFFLKRDEILLGFGKGVKFSGFWQRVRFLGFLAKGEVGNSLCYF